jgi:secretion/DNA translocation related TadE-like protein
MTLRTHISSDRGSVTVIAIALIALIVGAGLIAVAVLQLAIARANLGSFADLAALAAGQAFGNPCAAALHIAHANSVNLDSCVVKNQEVHIVVTKSTNGLGVLGLFTDPLTVSARATRLSPITE